MTGDPQSHYLGHKIRSTRSPIAFFIIIFFLFFSFSTFLFFFFLSFLYSSLYPILLFFFFLFPAIRILSFGICGTRRKFDSLSIINEGIYNEFVVELHARFE